MHAGFTGARKFIVHARELTQAMVEAPSSEQAGRAAKELKRKLQDGYPLRHLKPLLLSPSEAVVEYAVWIASELGGCGRPLLADVLLLLSHPSQNVRFDAIDCVLVWTMPSDGAAIAAVWPLLNDPAPSVRWKALDFWAKVRPEKLQAASSYTRAGSATPYQAAALEWLVAAGDPENVRSALQDVDPMIRKCAVIAAARLAGLGTGSPVLDVGPLMDATSSDDPDVKKFADSLQGIVALQKQRRSRGSQEE